MTLREMLGLVTGPVKLVVHTTNGTLETVSVTTHLRADAMRSTLEALAPTVLDNTVTSVDAENSRPVICGGSYFNDGPAFTVIHIMRRTVL